MRFMASPFGHSKKPRSGEAGGLENLGLVFGWARLGLPCLLTGFASPRHLRDFLPTLPLRLRESYVASVAALYQSERHSGANLQMHFLCTFHRDAVNSGLPNNPQ